MLDHEIIFKDKVQELHRLHPRCEPFPLQRTYGESHSVGPSRFIFDQDFGSRFQQMPLDLRLSIGNSYDDDAFDCEELNLSLSIGIGSNKRIQSSKKPLKDTMVYPSSPVTIDLEDSTESVLNEPLKANLRQDEVLATSVTCSHIEDDVIMNRDMRQGCSYLNEGSIGWHDIKRSVLADLDLNKIQPDEYPLCDDSCGEYGSQTTTSSSLKDQTKTCTIVLKSLPELSSDLTEEKAINISEASKQDYAVEKAALSLISISNQQTSTVSQDFGTKSVSIETENRNENKKKTITRSLSIDSYESLVLKLEESITKTDTATSKTYEMNELDPNPNGIKLKRGRRLKDFQKDILPTLSSLSKHEIWEDVKLLEGVIRSREYKRLNKAKTGKGENWSTPVKTKRAKVNSSSQRPSLQKRK